jgi:hypothetical protein
MSSLVPKVPPTAPQTGWRQRQRAGLQTQVREDLLDDLSL